MDVCLLMGKGNASIQKAVGKLSDNVKFYEFKDIKDMVKGAKLRHLEFKRIILSKALLSKPDSDLGVLNSFLREYGVNTEVIMVIQSAEDEMYIKAFKKYFDSPMYTPVIMGKPTAISLNEIVTADILSVRTKYYALDVKDSKIVPDEDEGEATGDQEGVQQSAGFGFGSGPSSVYGGYRGNSSSDWGSSERDMVEEEDSSDDGFDDLSIGDLGGLHTDTGYLDDFDDAELAAKFDEEKNKAKAAKRGRGGVPMGGMKDKAQELDASEEVEEVSEKEKYEGKVIDSVQKRYEKEQTISSDLNIDLVVSTGKYRCTQDMIDEALDIHRRDQARVLIIDLDTKSNRVLSLLHIDRYYSNNCQEGIAKQRVYTEDNIGVCSNGYGVPVQTKDLKALLASKVMKKYDLILIDCPTECLGVIDEEIIRMCHVLVFTGGSLEDLTDITMGLTNRHVVRLGVEKYIMRNCEIEVKGQLRKDDVEFIRDNCLFANGCWLDKI